MSNYYFSFLTHHCTLEGENMAAYWVRVVASDYMTARLLFIRLFSQPIMGEASKWGFQYPEHNWVNGGLANDFYGGEYALIEEGKEEVQYE